MNESGDIEARIGALESAGLPEGAFIGEKYRDEMEAAWDDAASVFPQLEGGDALAETSAILVFDTPHALPIGSAASSKRFRPSTHANALNGISR